MKRDLWLASCCMTIVIMLAGQVQAAVENKLETCEDEKCFKTMLKARPNLLVLFSNSDGQVRDVLRTLRETNPSIRDSATIAYINCETAKKLCKKLKITPNPYELKHYSEGVFNKDYDRQIAKKSLINFLKDPKGDLPWEEEENAKDVIHLKDEASLTKALKKYSKGILVMFYAPWCGFCKKLKPEYSEAATELKKAQSPRVIAAINVDNSENYGLRVQYNISGYPTLLYFRSGAVQFNYGGEYTKDSLIEWMKNPTPPKPKEPEKSWAEEDDVEVTFLTDDTFDDFIAQHNSVLVKFYAPWCGHCKNMKPVFNNVAKVLKEEKSDGVIAFVDATKETKVAGRFKIKGFPTVKYFKDGKFAWDYDERNEQKILEFMRNPVQPAPKVEEPSWAEEKSYVIHADESNLASHLKTKKHALVFFYAPWCGHCKNAKPHFTKAAEQFKEDLKVAFIAVDCTKNQAVCDQNNVKGFPTIIYFNFGKNSRPYDGGRTEKNFVDFMNNPNDPNAGKPSPKDEWLDLAGHEHVHFLDDANFDEFINSKKRVLVMFYAPWCGHCKAMKPAYAQAASEVTSFVPGSYLAAVDATVSPKLAERFKLQGYPTLKFFEQGQFKFDYSGGRNKDDFVSFLRNPVQPKNEL